VPCPRSPRRRSPDPVEVALQAVFLSVVPILMLGFALSWFLQEIPLRETLGPPVNGIEEASA